MSKYVVKRDTDYIPLGFIPAYTLSVQDDSGWTPLMISASVPDSEPVLRVLIQKGAEVNEKSKLSDEQ